MTEPLILDERAVEEIEARAAKATVGPWVYFGAPDDNVFWGEIRSAADDGHLAHITDTPEHDERDGDMEFIAHAREDIPALCATVKHLRAQASLAANLMRDKCVERLRAKREQRRKDLHAFANDDNHATDANYTRAVLFVLDNLIYEVESLTLDTVEQENQ